MVARVLHKGAIGNVAWGYYGAREGQTLDNLLAGASAQGRLANPLKGEDPYDQQMILRGFNLFKP